jgi:hypothetical protein
VELAQGIECVGIVRLLHRGVNRSRLITQGFARFSAGLIYARCHLDSGFVTAHRLSLQGAVRQEGRFVFSHVLALSKHRDAAVVRAVNDSVAIWARRVLGVKRLATAFAAYCMCGGRCCQHHAKQRCSDECHGRFRGPRCGVRMMSLRPLVRARSMTTRGGRTALLLRGALSVLDQRPASDSPTTWPSMMCSPCRMAARFANPKSAQCMSGT